MEWNYHKQCDPRTTTHLFVWKLLEELDWVLFVIEEEAMR